MRPLFSRFQAVRRTNEDNGTTVPAEADALTPAAQFFQAPSAKERSQVVFDSLRSRLARSLDSSPDDIDGTKTLSDYGVDSLMAVELRNWFRRDFLVDIPVFEILGHNDIFAVAELVTGRAEPLVGEKRT
jgi:acyl carrier protein